MIAKYEKLRAAQIAQDAKDLADLKAQVSSAKTATAEAKEQML